jgi:hypothetical protein
MKLSWQVRHGLRKLHRLGEFDNIAFPASGETVTLEGDPIPLSGMMLKEPWTELRGLSGYKQYRANAFFAERGPNSPGRLSHNL